MLSVRSGVGAAIVALGVLATTGCTSGQTKNEACTLLGERLSEVSAQVEHALADAARGESPAGPLRELEQLIDGVSQQVTNDEAAEVVRPYAERFTTFINEYESRTQAATAEERQESTSRLDEQMRALHRAGRDVDDFCRS